MQMQTLVKRRSDGGIQEWTIEVEGNAFRVTSGKRAGKKVVNEWTSVKVRIRESLMKQPMKNKLL